MIPIPARPRPVPLAALLAALLAVLLAACAPASREFPPHEGAAMPTALVALSSGNDLAATVASALRSDPDVIDRFALREADADWSDDSGRAAGLERIRSETETELAIVATAATLRCDGDASDPELAVDVRLYDTSSGLLLAAGAARAPTTAGELEDARGRTLVRELTDEAAAQMIADYLDLGPGAEERAGC